MLRRLCLFVPALVMVAAAAASAQGVRTPAPGSAERKAVADALRAPVEKELKQKVIFKIDHLKVSGDWAFLRGVPQRPDGDRVDYSATAYQQRIEDGVFDDWICALLRKRAGKWQVVKYVIGATDVAYEGWDDEYKAPSAIFN
ncbi:MAG TPA: hypothetical protein VF586_14705 [Pyrinomonadaceae bacterium]